jgi:hypothetical protein
VHVLHPHTGLHEEDLTLALGTPEAGHLDSAPKWVIALLAQPQLGFVHLKGDDFPVCVLFGPQ